MIKHNYFLKSVSTKIFRYFSKIIPSM